MIFGLLVQRISATFCCNCTKNGEGAKFGTNEADSTQIKTRLEAFRKFQNFS